LLTVCASSMSLRIRCQGASPTVASLKASLILSSPITLSFAAASPIGANQLNLQKMRPTSVGSSSCLADWQLGFRSVLIYGHALLNKDCGLGRGGFSTVYNAVLHELWHNPPLQSEVVQASNVLLDTNGEPRC
jgi:hypothetical protein